ncbi:MAG: hypothetical protein JWP59_921 [Massilia sp.]|nr:hypothetical protein [Massilia sp.]
MIVHAPSAGEFLHEFVGHYVALEGKLWQTLRLLIFKPGQLTVDFLRGRRIGSINPLRMYLTLSLVMFALIKMAGIAVPQLTLETDGAGISYAHSVADPARPGKSLTGTFATTVSVSEDGERLAIDRAVAALGSYNAHWAANGKRFMAAPPDEKAQLLNHGFLANLPYMLIGALPLFALYLKLLYLRSGRRYGEHLVFALHASAFAFFMAIVMIVLPGNFLWLLLTFYDHKPALASFWDALQVVPVLWLLAYLPVALRRVYGGSAAAAWARSLLLLSVHAAVIVGLIIGAEIIAILGHG